MSEDVTLTMLFSNVERDDIRDYCVEKDVSVYDLIRGSVLDQIVR